MKEQLEAQKEILKQLQIASDAIYAAEKLSDASPLAVFESQKKALLNALEACNGVCSTLEREIESQI